MDHSQVECALPAGQGFTESTWVADGGASTHIGNIDDGMHDVECIDEPVKVGNGAARATKKGTLLLTLLQRDGQTIDLTLKDYEHAPEFKVCSFSVMKASQQDWRTSNKGLQLKLTKGKDTVLYD